MENVINNLDSIEDWINQSSNPKKFTRNDEFMEFSVELMNHCLYLMKCGVALVADQDEAIKGVTKHKAIIIAHMVRIIKLYEGLLIHVANRQLDLAVIFNRLIFETAMRMKYMINSKTKQKSIRSFIISSYNPEKEMLNDLEEKKRNRALIPIEKRMLRSIKGLLQRDGITISELMNNKWKTIDGKDFRSLLKALGEDHKYPYLFGNGSHNIHGDWHDINFYHLDKKGRYYFPKINYTDPDPRISGPITWFCLELMEDFLTWRKSDPNNVILPIIKQLWELNRNLDNAHEATLQK